MVEYYIESSQRCGGSGYRIRHGMTRSIAESGLRLKAVGNGQASHRRTQRAAVVNMREIRTCITCMSSSNRKMITLITILFLVPVFIVTAKFHLTYTLLRVYTDRLSLVTL
jgi:hypothetical protein